jgi:DNA gyrase subunit A
MGIFGKKKADEFESLHNDNLFSDDDDIILIASDGIIIRIPADGISTFARPSKGVRVMRVTEGEKLITITPVEHEDAEENSETEVAQAEENAAEATQEETTPEN